MVDISRYSFSKASIRDPAAYKETSTIFPSGGQHTEIVCELLVNLPNANASVELGKGTDISKQNTSRKVKNKSIK